MPVVGTFDLALVGTGGIAVHAEAVAGLGGRARVVVAVDVDWDRLLAFGQRFAVPRLYRDVDAMLAAEEPHLVHLCTPPGLHAEQAITCLRRVSPSCARSRRRSAWPSWTRYPRPPRRPDRRSPRCSSTGSAAAGWPCAGCAPRVRSGGR